MPRKRAGHATAGSQDDNQALLIQTSTILDSMNTRLFGLNGDGGAFHFIMEQHKELDKKIEENKEKILEKIELRVKNTEEKVERIRTDYTSLDRKVTRWSGAITATQFIIGLGLTALGFKIRAGR
jgi:hypothetical protein